MISTLLFIVISMTFGTALAQQAEAPPPSQQPSNRVPLYLDVQDNELKIKNPQITYDLKTSKGKELAIGGLIVNSDSLSAYLEDGALVLTWDALLISTGDISIINQQGKELWKKKVDVPGALTVKDLDGPEAPKWKDGEKFRFCLRSEIGRGYSSFCTPWYAIEFRENQKILGYARANSSSRVIVQNEEAKLKDSREVPYGAPAYFMATLESGATFEFLSEPIAPIVRDMIAVPKSDRVQITGEMPRPLNMDSSRPPLKSSSRLVKLLGFEDTINLPPDLWQAEFLKTNLQLIFPGKSGGVFTYNLELSKLPSEKDRRFISDKTLRGTYSSKDQILVQDSEGRESMMAFEAPKKFAFNKINLELPWDGVSPHRSYLDVYRGGPGEASLRLTSVSTNGSQFVIFTETHVSWWFNDIFGWQNSLLSKQRWGVSAKYFSSMSPVPARNSDGSTAELSVSVFEADLRYRLTPGLWERDETLGLIASFETVDIGSDSVPKLGVGVFWARSMPRVLDDLLNQLSFFKYPKWVDMEFIRYTTSLSSNIELGNDYALNFHGKVMWTPEFFGEAGFGIKSYNYSNFETRAGAAMSTFYGTMGVGVDF